MDDQGRSCINAPPQGRCSNVTYVCDGGLSAIACVRPTRCSNPSPTAHARAELGDMFWAAALCSYGKSRSKRSTAYQSCAVRSLGNGIDQSAEARGASASHTVVGSAPAAGVCTGQCPVQCRCSCRRAHIHEARVLGALCGAPRHFVDVGSPD